MDKLSVKTRNALKSALQGLIELSKDILVFGENKSSCDTFCKPINISKAMSRLLACTKLEIRRVGFYVEAEKAFVAWFKQNIRCPTENHVWWTLASPSNWIKYNIDRDLYVLKLSVGSVIYYVLLRYEIVLKFREKL